MLALLREARLPTEGVEAATLLVARGGGISGAVGLEVYGAQALLRSLVVRPDARGSGLGQGLVTAALDLARHRGVREVYLLTETASGFFPRFGFMVVERAAITGPVLASVEFAGACAETAVAMRRDL